VLAVAAIPRERRKGEIAIDRSIRKGKEGKEKKEGGGKEGKKRGREEKEKEQRRKKSLHFVSPFRDDPRKMKKLEETVRSLPLLLLCSPPLPLCKFSASRLQKKPPFLPLFLPCATKTFRRS
jgi:hypothetical protein